MEYPNLERITTEFASKEDFIRKLYDYMKLNGHYISIDSNDDPFFINDDYNIGAGIEHGNLTIFDDLTNTYFAFDIFEDNIELLNEFDVVIMKIGKEGMDLFFTEEDTEMTANLDKLSKHLTTLFEMIME